MTQITNGCCDGDIPTEEPLADWEKELLKPDPNLVIHIYPAEGMTACDIKLDDGNTHAVNSKIENVSCGDCRINYLTYVNEQLQAEVAREKENARIAQQASTGWHREVVNLRRRRESDANTIRQMREDIAYLRDGGYYERGHSGYPPVRRPIQNPFRY